MVKKFIKTKNHQGFTLIELIVVIGIMSILSALALAGYSSGRQSYNVNVAIQRLANDISRMQNLALTPKIEKGQTIPSCGYGIYVVSSSQYKLFYNVETHCNPDDPYYYKNSHSQDLQTVDLSGSGVTL